jgi:hypothetical protein
MSDTELEENGNEVPNEIPEAPGDLKELTAKAEDLKEMVEKAKANLKVIADEFESVKNEILRTITLLNLDSIKGSGYLFFQKNHSSVSTPKTMEDKMLLFEYLQQRGIFNEMVGVNSQTLNKLYKDEAEAALKEGKLEFNLPGVAEPVPYVTLEMRKSK